METLAKIYLASTLKKAQKKEIMITCDQNDLDYLSDEAIFKLNNIYKLSYFDKDSMPEELISQTLSQLESEIERELTPKNSVEAAYAGFYEMGALQSDESHLWKMRETKEWN